MIHAGTGHRTKNETISTSASISSVSNCQKLESLLRKTGGTFQNFLSSPVDPILTFCAVVQVEYLSVCYLPVFSWLPKPFLSCPFPTFELWPTPHNKTPSQTNAHHTALGESWFLIHRYCNGGLACRKCWDYGKLSCS